MSLAQLPREQLVERAEEGTRAKNSLRRLRDSMQAQMQTMVHSIESSTASLGFGFFRGRFAAQNKAFEVFGVPADLAGGVILKALAFGGVFDNYDGDANAFGQGAVDSYLTTLGVRMGMQSLQEADAAGRPAAAGYGGRRGAERDLASRMAASLG